MPNRKERRKARHKRRHAAILAAAKAELHKIECSGEVEITAAADGEKTPTFAITAYTGGKLKVDAYFSPVVLDLAGLQASGEQIPTFLGHDPAQIVGHGTPEISAQRVKIAGVISGGGPAAAEVVAAAQKGFPWKASVGVMPSKVERVDAGSTAKANGRNWDGPVNIVRAGTLAEISFVPIGADAKTSVSIAAQQQKEHSMPPELVEWIKAEGFDPDTLSEKQSRSLEAAWKAERKASATPPPAAPPVKSNAEDNQGDDDPLVAYRETIGIEAKRVADIHAKNAEYGGEHHEIVAKAIGEGWDVSQAEVEMLRASRPKAPAGHVHTPDRSAKVIEAAACHALGLNVEKDFDEKTLEAADREFRHEIGIQEMLTIAARANGWSGTAFRSGDLKTILGYAFPPVHAAAAQTGFSLSGILGNTANKSILESFNFVESTWRDISAVSSVTNFHTQTRYRLTGNATYEKLAPDGQIRHGTLDETSYTISADTYAKMYVFDRKDIINDDLGALDRVARRLGRGAALKINNIFWTAFLDDSSFFAAGNSNLVTGSTYALTAADPIASLAQAELTFLNQTDPDSDPIGVEPRILLVPNALWAYARELMESTTITTGGASSKTKQGTRNIYSGAYRVVKSSYLGNSGYTGYSTTAWYLLADPADLAVIEVAFLNGRQAPVIESSDADFDVLGIKIRGYHDFGVSKQEYRGGVKLTGTT